MRSYLSHDWLHRSLVLCARTSTLSFRSDRRMLASVASLSRRLKCRLRASLRWERPTEDAAGERCCSPAITTTAGRTDLFRRRLLSVIFFLHLYEEKTFFFSSSLHFRMGTFVFSVTKAGFSAVPTCPTFPSFPLVQAPFLVFRSG